MPMTPEEIKKELDIRGISMAALGRRLRPKVARFSVARVVDQVPGSSSKRIQRVVANAIGRTPEEVFGTSDEKAVA
jgi:lambda repressor-like predicted transcriptional regulator